MFYEEMTTFDYSHDYFSWLEGNIANLLVTAKHEIPHEFERLVKPPLRIIINDETNFITVAIGLYNVGERPVTVWSTTIRKSGDNVNDRVQNTVTLNDDLAWLKPILSQLFLDLRKALDEKAGREYQELMESAEKQAAERSQAINFYRHLYDASS